MITVLIKLEFVGTPHHTRSQQKEEDGTRGGNTAAATLPGSGSSPFHGHQRRVPPWVGHVPGQRKQ
jgi:hypothetical protein